MPDTPDIHVRTARLSEAKTILKLVHESMSHYCKDSGIPDSSTFCPLTMDS